MTRVDGRLPPGQRRAESFPRFGLHLDRPPPVVPAEPVIAVEGAVTAPFAIPLADLAILPSRELVADFHCVAGWSASDLQWEGVAFALFYRTTIAPKVAADTVVTHLVFGGLDGYRIAVTIEDALADDVLLAQHLGGRPLDGDHGAPVRLVSPRQYGFVSVKHLARIEVHTSEPRDSYDGHPLSRLFLRVFSRHPRARVWEEERHRYLPAWSIRLLGRALMAPVKNLSARGRPRGRGQ